MLASTPEVTWVIIYTKCICYSFSFASGTQEFTTSMCHNMQNDNYISELKLERRVKIKKGKLELSIFKCILTKQRWSLHHPGDDRQCQQQHLNSSTLQIPLQPIFWQVKRELWMARKYFVVLWSLFHSTDRSMFIFITSVCIVHWKRRFSPSAQHCTSINTDPQFSLL